MIVFTLANKIKFFILLSKQSLVPIENVLDYYPLKDITTNQYWKLRIDDGRLNWIENNEAESKSNPIIQDKKGGLWELAIDAGRMNLRETTKLSITRFYLKDLKNNNIWQIIAQYGVVGIEMVTSALLFVLENKETLFVFPKKQTSFVL